MAFLSIRPALQRIGVTALLGLFLGGTAVAQDAAPADEMSEAELEAEWRAQDQLKLDITRAAFDTDSYFSNRYTDPEIRIRYIADYDFPVWAMRIVDGTLDDPRGAGWSARILTAPALDEAERPRDAGAALFYDIWNDMKKHPDTDLRHALDRTGLKWLETDTRSCPALEAGLKRTGDINWLESHVRPPGKDNIVIIIHADTVSVKFDNSAHIWHAEYRGQIDSGNPAGWAVKLRTAMKPCWKPAGAPVPWRVEKVSANGGAELQ